MYTQSTQRIEIVVKKDNVETKGTSTTETEDSTTQDKKNEKNGKLSARQKKLIRVNMSHAISTARQITQLALNYEIGGTAYLSGDQTIQENIQRKVEIYKDFSGVITAGVMGGLYGASGGPIGVAVGAILGVAGTASSTAIKYLGREREESIKEFKLSNNLAYKQARANISLTNGRLR